MTKIAHAVLVRIEQELRGIAAECNRKDWPEGGLAAQQALVAVDGLHSQLAAQDLDEMQFEPIKSETDEEAEEIPTGTVRQ